MKQRQTKLLSQMVSQFQKQHQRLPDKIVVSPAALTVLTFRRSASKTWAGVSLICRDIGLPDKKADKANAMGVILVDGALRSFDLAL